MQWRVAWAALAFAPFAGCLAPFDTTHDCTGNAPYTTYFDSPGLYARLPIDDLGEWTVDFEEWPTGSPRNSGTRAAGDPLPTDAGMDLVSSPLPDRRKNEHLTFYEGHYVAALMSSRSDDEVETLFRPFIQTLVEADEPAIDRLTEWFFENATKRGRDAGYHLEVPYPSKAWSFWDERVRLGVDRVPDPHWLLGMSFRAEDWHFTFLVPIKNLALTNETGSAHGGFRIGAADRVEWGHYDHRPSKEEAAQGFRNLTRSLGIANPQILAFDVLPTYACP